MSNHQLAAFERLAFRWCFTELGGGRGETLLIEAIALLHCNWASRSFLI